MTNEVKIKPGMNDTLRLKREISMLLKSNGTVPEHVVLRVLETEQLGKLIECGTDRDESSPLYTSYQKAVMGILGLTTGQVTFGIYDNAIRGYEFLRNEKLTTLPQAVIAVYKRGPNLRKLDELSTLDGGLICLDEIIRSLTYYKRKECMFYFPIGRDPKQYYLGHIKLTFG